MANGINLKTSDNVKRIVDIFQSQLKEGGGDRLDPTYSLDAAAPRPGWSCEPIFSIKVLLTKFRMLPVSSKAEVSKMHVDGSRSFTLDTH